MDRRTWRRSTSAQNTNSPTRRALALRLQLSDTASKNGAPRELDMSEIVSTAGSGLTFENYYGAGVTEAFRGAILTAEHELSGLSSASQVPRHFAWMPSS